MASISPARRLLTLAAAGCVAAALASQLPAQAAPGTWTKVISPAAGKVVLSQSGAEGHWTIKGTASSGVSEVNVYCIGGNGSPQPATTVATAVPVASGAFATTVPVPSGAIGQCRLRALPDGVNPQASYLAAYAGPVVNIDSWTASTTNFSLAAAAGSAGVLATAAGACGIQQMAPIEPDQTIPGGTAGCLVSLANNVNDTGAAVVVDGHQAFPAPDDHLFGVTPISAVSSTFRVTKADTVRWTDVEPLDRCITDTQWPPTSSCSLRSAGVQFRRVSTLLKDGQVTMRDEFRSTDGRKHVLKLALYCQIDVNAGGLLGLRFPGQKGFHDSKPSQKVTHLGPVGAGTMLATADRFADQGDPGVDTQALSWSRRPTRLVFATVAEGDFEMDYRLVVPRGGSAYLGFADSVGLLTADAKALGAKAERAMMPAPVIVSPHDGAVVTGTKTTVAGVLHAGANGLPVWAKVDGHRVKLKVNRAGTRATFTDTFHESLGKHAITVLAQDAGGNRRSTTIHVVNK